MVEFGEWLCTEVLKYVPHRQWVFVSTYTKTAAYLFYDGPQAVVKAEPMRLESVESVFETGSALRGCSTWRRHCGVPLRAGFGDFLGFNSHLHVIATDGCFYGPASAGFKACPTPNPKDLEDLFRDEVFKMLKAEGKITDSAIENILNWHHSGFNVYCGNAIWPHNEEGLRKPDALYLPASGGSFEPPSHKNG